MWTKSANVSDAEQEEVTEGMCLGVQPYQFELDPVDTEHNDQQVIMLLCYVRPVITNASTV